MKQRLPIHLRSLFSLSFLTVIRQKALVKEGGGAGNSLPLAVSVGKTLGQTFPFKFSS